MNEFSARVVEKTSAKIRKFLYELAEGTSDYRSLHNLTEQVEHQYHGRFIIELIQNAHDALFPVGSSQSAARIVFAIRNEGSHGTLYVANDGQPFSHSNFDSLSQLGNSDKNPQDSIGNKGIGFRSVLEISSSPSIYSRRKQGSTSFDGYRFEFSPSIIDKLQAPILKLVVDQNNSSPLWGSQSLVDWDSGLLKKFREAVKTRSSSDDLETQEWIKRELSYLSPYLLPVPLDDSCSEAVLEFERDGYSSLIRLPFKSDVARELAQRQIRALKASALLFLDRATSLTLDEGEGRSRKFECRHTNKSSSQLNTTEVLITTSGENDVARYLVWRSELSILGSAEDVQAALRQLPGKWHELKRVMVSVGVRLNEYPESGNLSIFLPTLLLTGCSAHINAPFFGDMSRTLVDFGSDESGQISAASVYNNYLLCEAAKLVLRVVSEELAGKEMDEARVILDLIAPAGKDDGAKRRWQDVLSKMSEIGGFDLHHVPWFLSDRGWCSICEIFLIPDLSTPKVITQDALRSSATFAALHFGLDSRRMLFKSLTERYCFNPLPSDSDLADTVELIAQFLHGQPEADWNGFWLDIDMLFKSDCKALIGKRVLLGNDSQLHAGGSNRCTVFFIPRQGASDDEEVENDTDIKEIPSTLSPFVAFLSEQIHVYEEKNGRLQQTRIRKLLLESKLVSRFRREDILSDVLLSKVPTLPVPLSGPHSEVCRDILQWGLRLLALLVDRGKGDRLFKLLQRLPVPCQGGWYPMVQAAFGSGWPNSNGDITDRYLLCVRSAYCTRARERLLLPPSDVRWGVNPQPHRHLLQQAGVFDGLRLQTVELEAPSKRFDGIKGSFLLPCAPPSDYLSADWDAFRQAVKDKAKPSYNSGRYEVYRLQVLPGLDRYNEFETETRLAFMDAVLASAVNWDDGWDTMLIRRVEGNSDSFSVPSPVAWKLCDIAWLGINEDDVRRWYRPMDRWYVPSQASVGRRHHFSPFIPIARRFDAPTRFVSSTLHCHAAAGYATV
jgi:hypothetical protein